MSDLENSNNPNIENKVTIQKWEKIAKHRCVSSFDILKLGNTIQKKGIRPKDALHIACAIVSNCKFFITTDKGLTNKIIDNIRILNPIDFVREMDDHNEN